MDDALRAGARRRILTPVSAALALTTVLLALLPELPPWAEYLPFLVSLMVLGLPHGALDHLVPARMSAQRTVAGSIVRVGVLYAVLGGLVLASWLVFPVGAFVFFIALTWYHWGQGDLWALVHLTGATHLRTVGTRVLTVVVRGALPMLVPFIAFPGAYLGVVTTTAGLFGDGVPVSPAALDGLRSALLIGFAVTVILLFLLSARTGGRFRPERSWWVDAGEVALLAVYFATVPPIFAVGIYFCFWHSLRHIIRLQLITPQAVTALREGATLRALAVFARDAAPTTVIALLILVTAALTAGVTGGIDATRLLGVYLVLLSALTLPHVVVVTYMDRRDQLWRP